MSGRNPPSYCTLTLIAMQGHQQNGRQTNTSSNNKDKFNTIIETSTAEDHDDENLHNPSTRPRYSPGSRRRSVGDHTRRCLLFLTFSVLVANPKKLLYTVANPARGLLNREKRTKEKVWQHTPPPTPHTARSEKINKITRRIYRRYAGLGRSRIRTRIPSARRLGLWV